MGADGLRPWLVLVVGHTADRFDRRHVLRVCQLVAMVAVVTLATGSTMGWITEHLIFALVFVVGCARAFEMPTMQALLPALVPVRLLPRAVASSASAAQTAITDAGLTVGAADPAAMRRRWTELGLDHAVQFVPASERGGGIDGLDLVATDRARAGETTELCGVAIRFV